MFLFFELDQRVIDVMLWWYEEKGGGVASKFLCFSFLEVLFYMVQLYFSQMDDIFVSIKKAH